MNCPICKTEYDSSGRCPNCGFHDSMDFLAHPTAAPLTVDDTWNWLHYKDCAFCAASEPHKPQLTTEEKAFAINVADRLKAVRVGSTVPFGRYVQQSTVNKSVKAVKARKIEWQVLDRQGNKLLLISKYALDCRPYNTTGTDVTWETCSLREWMNGTFLNNAFSAEEQAIIQSTKVSADKNPNYSTNPGNDTKDKIFLLSITEAEKYFSSDEDRMCVPTAYALAQGAYPYSDVTKDDAATCWWWLRSPGDRQDRAAFVYDVGSVRCYGLGVDLGYDCVRPALWINLES